MNLREAAQQALEALEVWRDCLTDPRAMPGWRFAVVGEKAITALRSALDQPVYKSMQVRPAEFVEIVKGQETVTGVPMFWSEWPTE